MTVWAVFSAGIQPWARSTACPEQPTHARKHGSRFSKMHGESHPPTSDSKALKAPGFHFGCPDEGLVLVGFCCLLLFPKALINSSGSSPASDVESHSSQSFPCLQAKRE